MSNSLIKSIRIEKKINFLKILVAVSFLIIIVPEDHPVDWTSLMLVNLINALKDMIITKMKPFDIFGILIVGYVISIIYLFFFSFSTKRIRIILLLMSLFILFIPTVLIMSYIIAARVFWLPSIITILIFYMLATSLSILLFKQVKS